MDQSRETLAWRYGMDLMASCTRNTVLFAEEDNDYFSAGYLQEVQGHRKDVEVVTNFLWQETWGVERWKTRYPDWNLELHPEAEPWDRAGDNLRRAIGALKGKRPIRSTLSLRFFRNQVLREPTPWKTTPYGLAFSIVPKKEDSEMPPTILVSRIGYEANRKDRIGTPPCQLPLRSAYLAAYQNGK